MQHVIKTIELLCLENRELSRSADIHELRRIQTERAIQAVQQAMQQAEADKQRIKQLESQG